MMASPWRKVGKVKDAHGLRGDLTILIFSKDVSWSADLQMFALGDEKSDPQAFEVEKIKPFKDGLILKAKTVLDRTQAEALKGRLFYIPEELLQSSDGETIYLTEIEGFEIFDSQAARQGQIIGFSSNGAQDLLIVQRPEGLRAEIPFVEDFIGHIDFEKRQIQMNLPEGIWDLNAL